MSRVGKLPIKLPVGVTADIESGLVKISGPLGFLSKSFGNEVSVVLDGSDIIVSKSNDTKFSRSMWGTARSIINNMVSGVTKGFSKELEIFGVGYRAALRGKYLNISLGKSHNTKIEVPEDLKIELPKPTELLIKGIDKEKVGQFAATIIKQRPPEPYKGKGIKVKGQHIVRKAGKKA